MPTGPTGPPTLAIAGLRTADQLDLSEHLGNEVTVERVAAGNDALPEPFTVIALVVGTAAALKGLVAFLAAKSQREAEESVTVTIEKRDDAGTPVETETITVSSKGKPMTPELAKQLGSFSGVPWKELLTP
jgi:hypothetical protein